MASQLPEKLGRSGVAAGPRVVARTESLRTQSARHGVGREALILSSVPTTWCYTFSHRSFAVPLDRDMNHLAFLISRLGRLRYCKRLLEKTANCFRTGQLSILTRDVSIQGHKLGRL